MNQSSIILPAPSAADANVSDLKRKADPVDHDADSGDDSGDHGEESNVKSKKAKQDASVKTREMRLEQNRKAARESRRRKKVLVEELQRSVIFFSRANGSLRTQNEELEQLVLQARTQIKAAEGAKQFAIAQSPPTMATVGTTDAPSWTVPAVNLPGFGMDPNALMMIPQQVLFPQMPGAGVGDQATASIDGNMLANWMNLQAAMGGVMNPMLGMSLMNRSVMGGLAGANTLPGMMVMPFPQFTQQGGVSNPLGNSSNGEGTSG